ncbi:hypothetical protein QZH41_002290 [Actinostola sp. cb2023]|nr:hypothetical protein QZH41_002290 [Actinostola sp. cb2023]
MNELQIRGPGEMDFTSQQNVSETWRRWERGMEYYLAATCKAKSEAEKVAIFMCMIGRDGQEIKDTFEFEVDEDGSEVVSTTILFNKFEAHCKPRKNLVVDRHRFLTRDQASDARSGFWQIPLDDESSTLTTFATPYGRYRFTRMPFGIHSAQEVFHKRLHELFQDLSGVETDIDDILVWGRTREEHDERLAKTLQRARESNLKLNPDKCKIRRTKILYIGHVLTTDGVKPDVSKLEAITSMPTPEDKHGIQRLLGMVNYVAKFLPNISEVTSPLRELLKKDVAWHWTERYEQSFNDIKKLLT